MPDRINDKQTAISLFCSSGIGDLAFRRTGIEVLLANELIPERCDLFAKNFPDTYLVKGSIWDHADSIVDESLKRLGDRPLNYALVTPPCQGMSKNGRGKLLAEIKAGKRPKVDPRNLLILPALEVIKRLRPEVVIFENVSEMLNTSIPMQDEVLGIIDIIKRELSDWYVEEKVIELADYGIPQSRKRLITIATRKKEHKLLLDKFSTLFPPPTHSKHETMFTSRWVSVRDIIGNLEILDGKSKRKSDLLPLHYVARLDDKKYFWVSSTPEGKSAFDNQCNECDCRDNITHKSNKNDEGVNRSSRDTPIYCYNCGALLPRPVVTKGGEVRLMRGFTSAYKRMDWDSPSSALTRNFPYACSDNKIHPDQNRTLSVLEATMLHTIKDDEFKFENASGSKVGFTAIRDTLGESIPPKFLEILIQHLKC